MDVHLAICDDNLEELSHLSALLDRYSRERGGSVTYGAFQSGMELLEAWRAGGFDLLLLDILMPEVSGMEVAREIRLEDEKVPILFLTASPEFAVESYRVHAADYIMKPIRADEIFLALDQQLAKFSQAEAFVTLRAGGGLAKLPLSQIVAVEVFNHAVRFTLSNGVVREVYGQLADYEKELLSAPGFYKPHRSYLVNLRQVVTLDKAGFTTTVGKVVPVPRDGFVKAKAAYTKALLEKEDG